MSATALIHQMATRARAAARQLATPPAARKSSPCTKSPTPSSPARPSSSQENAKDIEQAKNDGLAAPLIARLTLGEKKIAAMAQGLREIAAQTDPVGQTIEAYDRPNGLRIEKRRVPIGVVAIIFESRPNVTADAAGHLPQVRQRLHPPRRQGSAPLQPGHRRAASPQGLKAAGLPADAVQLVETTDRAVVTRHGHAPAA